MNWILAMFALEVWRSVLRALGKPLPWEWWVWFGFWNGVFVIGLLSKTFGWVRKLSDPEARARFVGAPPSAPAVIRKEGM